jgi:hypothetical protein
MTVRSRTLQALTVTATGAMALALSTGPAQADFGRVIHGGDNIHYGSASFVARGDSLVVCDGRRDGYSVTVQVRTLGGRLVNTVRASGKGECVREDSHDVNLKEGRKYSFWGNGGPGGAYHMTVDKA